MSVCWRKGKEDSSLSDASICLHHCLYRLTSRQRVVWGKHLASEYNFAPKLTLIVDKSDLKSEKESTENPSWEGKQRIQQKTSRWGWT